MPILNLGCGSNRPPEPWVNLDTIRSQFPVGTPERTNLDTEKNYVEHPLNRGRLPFQDDSFEGVLASHIIEHFNQNEAIRIMQDCFRILKVGGVMMVSVPDTSYFRKVQGEDNRDNAVRLFGEPIYTEGKMTFRSYAVHLAEHCALFTEDVLWSYLRETGFEEHEITRLHLPAISDDEATQAMISMLNRIPFSLVMTGRKI